MQQSERFILTILDGWGHGPYPERSAIAQAKTPFIDSLYASYPNTELLTDGLNVGLPQGQMGNSEVGHMNLGAGRIIFQELVRITKAIEDGAVENHPLVKSLIEKSQTTGADLHIMGLVSDGGVHSHIDHLEAICDILDKKYNGNIYIHAFTDGRDVDPKSGARFVARLINHFDGTSVKLASVVGRYYAMDRDKRWERTKLAYDMLVHGQAEMVEIGDVISAMRNSYDNDVTDEFIKPILVSENGRPISQVKTGDSLLFFNFRTDRPRQLTYALTQNDLSEFGMYTMELDFYTMTQYDESFKGLNVLFESENVDKTMGEIMAYHGKKQLRIAETEKYAHVTFFFNGGREQPFENEDRIMVPSPKVATYDLQPEMSAYKVTEQLTDYLQNELPDFVCLNFANSDMVGHTGILPAAIKAAEAVDDCLSIWIPKALKMGYDIMVIADHGNSDYMINDDGTPNTAHSLNPVPCILVTEKFKDLKLHKGILADVAPSILTLMGMPKPEVMRDSILFELEKVIDPS